MNTVQRIRLSKYKITKYRFISCITCVGIKFYIGSIFIGKCKKQNVVYIKGARFPNCDCFHQIRKLHGCHIYSNMPQPSCNCTVLLKLAKVEQFKIRNYRSTLASFDKTVQLHEGCDMSL